MFTTTIQTSNTNTNTNTVEDQLCPNVGAADKYTAD